MSHQVDPELEDVLGDPELLHIAALLSAATTPEPPLDDAFKSSLRRQLMEQAWGKAEGRNSWWRRLSTPPGMAWAGAAAGVLLVASVVVYTAAQQPGGFTTTIVEINSPQQDKNAVALQQPILVSFTQPMDHQSTEAAVQITPATTVAFRWGGDTNLYIQPTSGNLAPNTQYQVTIGSGARTQANTPIPQPKTITFVTQPTASPAPPPSPSPVNNSLLTGQVQVGSIAAGTFYPPQWSADSATVYFVGAGGALEAVPARGGDVKTLVADGVSLPAMAPAGDRIAYVRSGKIEILTLATGATTEVAASPSALAWVKDRLYWAGGDGVFSLGPDGPEKLAAGPDPSGTALSIAPDGAHAAFLSANTLLLLDVAKGTTVQLGLPGAPNTFQGWSPTGTRVVYGGVIADMEGKTVASLQGQEVSWSATNEVLLGSDTDLYETRPDGSGLLKLAAGTFRFPAWAPDSATFAFLRGNALYVATAPAPAPRPGAVEQASAVAADFMQARLGGNPDRAASYLDDAGKAAYAAGTPALIPSSDLGFRRFYIITAEQDPTAPNTVRVVVRMVFGQGKLDRSAVEETLTLRRAEGTDPFRVDGVGASAQRDLGKGPEVVAVTVTSSEVQVTFDSDLIATTVSGVSLQDGQGLPIEGSVTYTDRTVKFSGLQLVPGERYRLVVMPSLEDVGSRHAASEYDLDLIGPAAAPTSGGVEPTPVPPSPATSPSPSPTATAR